jgi:hypothetical protein
MARRAAVQNGLTDYGMSLEDAEQWCDAWDIEAASRRLPLDADSLAARRGVDQRATGG